MITATNYKKLESITTALENATGRPVHTFQLSNDSINLNYIDNNMECKILNITL